MAERRIAVDLARVFGEDGKQRAVLAWGDAVDVVEDTGDEVRIRWTDFVEQPDGSQEPVATEGRIRKRALAAPVDDIVVTPANSKVLKVDFVDVQQGDGSVVESPDGKVVLIDGGENQLFARYLAGRYRGTSLQDPRRVEAIVITHGDADHFDGLSKIHESEEHDVPHKRLFIQPARVFHNGIVKRPESVDEAERLGETEVVGERTIITGLVDDPRNVPAADRNGPFDRWCEVLDAYDQRKDVAVRRLQHGDHDAFDFLASEDITTEVLGPIPITIDDVTGLEYLRKPKRVFGHPSQHPQTEFGEISPSHAINGQSIVLRLGYGDWHFLFAGDLNEQAEATLADDPEVELESEVFKVPHHGSHEFLHRFLDAVRPVVSVVSSGDEGASDHIHPRATLMGALGRSSREIEPVLFVTEMVAYFKKEGYVLNDPPDDGREWAKRRDPFFAFSRAAFGIVRVRTDGERLLVYTDSGQADRKEAYAYVLDGGKAVPQELRKV